MSRLTPIKIGAALVVALALSIGAAACGSGSSSDSTQSTSEVKKEAGIGGRPVSLTVVNQGQDALTLDLCADPDNCRTGGLQPGESNTMVADEVTGSIRYQNGDRVDFDADTPILGRPFIRLSSAGSSGDDATFNLSEGETQTANFSGHDFRASRSADTENKELTLEVLG